MTSSLGSSKSINAETHSKPTALETAEATEYVPDCAGANFLLTPCAGEADQTVIYTDTDLSSYVGKVIKISGDTRCFSVTQPGSDQELVQSVTFSSEYTLCVDCMPKCANVCESAGFASFLDETVSAVLTKKVWYNDSDDRIQIGSDPVNEPCDVEGETVFTATYNVEAIVGLTDGDVQTSIVFTLDSDTISPDIPAACSGDHVFPSTITFSCTQDSNNDRDGWGLPATGSWSVGLPDISQYGFYTGSGAINGFSGSSTYLDEGIDGYQVWAAGLLDSGVSTLLESFVVTGIDAGGCDETVDSCVEDSTYGCEMCQEFTTGQQGQLMRPFHEFYCPGDSFDDGSGNSFYCGDGPPDTDDGLDSCPDSVVINDPTYGVHTACLVSCWIKDVTASNAWDAGCCYFSRTLLDAYLADDNPVDATTAMTTINIGDDPL